MKMQLLTTSRLFVSVFGCVFVYLFWIILFVCGLFLCVCLCVCCVCLYFFDITYTFVIFIWRADLTRNDTGTLFEQLGGGGGGRIVACEVGTYATSLSLSLPISLYLSIYLSIYTYIYL